MNRYKKNGIKFRGFYMVKIGVALHLGTLRRLFEDAASDHSFFLKKL